MPKLDTPGDRGPDRNDLTGSQRDLILTAEDRDPDTELGQIGTAFQRSLEDTRGLDTATIVEKYHEYLDEVVYAAGVAKAQFEKGFDGYQPTSGKFGLDHIYHGYFGWNAWDNLGSLTGGSTAPWIDGATPDNLGGNASNPATVGDQAVHLILGVGDYNPSSPITGVNWRLNDQPRTTVHTESSFRNTDLQIQWLDTPVLLREDDDVSADVYAAEDGEAAPHLVGVTFIEEKPYRELLPSEMAGTDTAGEVIVEN